MSGAPSPSPGPRWAAPVLTGILAGQLVLLWLQGSMLNRQHQDLVAIREEIQTLAESLDEVLAAPAEEPSGLEPMKGAHRAGRRAGLRRTAAMVQEEPEPAPKELQESRDSAKKAVEKARDTQQKLSIEENARKAEEARKAGEVQRKGQGWLLGLLGVALLAVVIRGVAKRRG